MQVKKLAWISIACYTIGLMFYSFDQLAQSFPSIITNELMKSFTTSSIGIGVIASSYFYSYNLMQIPAGIFCDQFGTKNILLTSIIICIFGLTFFTYSHSINQAVFSRILMGFGASSAAVLFVIICRQYFEAKYLPVLLGIGQFTGNIGSICGQYPLSLMTKSHGWRASIILLNLIPIILFILTIFFIKKPQINFIKNKNIKIYDKIKTVFINKSNWTIALYAMLLWTPFYTFSSLWGVPFLKESLNLSTTTASQLIAISWVGSGVGSILIGMWSSYLGKRKICLAVSALIGIVIFPLMIFTKSNNIILVSIMLFIFGCASAGQALSFALINDCNKNENLGMAVGFNNTIIMIGPMLIDPIIGCLIKNNWNGKITDGIPYYSLADYNQAFLVIPLLFTLAFIVSLLCREIKPNKISNAKGLVLHTVINN